MSEGARSVLAVVAFAGFCASTVPAVESFRQLADEFVPSVEVAGPALRELSPADADRALGGAPWNRPTLRWALVEREHLSHGEVQEASRAKVGGRLTVDSLDEIGLDGSVWSQVSVTLGDRTLLRCTADHGGGSWPAGSELIEFRQGRDLRVTEFRCRTPRPGSGNTSGVGARAAVEQVVSRDRAELPPGARAAIHRYQRGCRQVELGLGALVLLAAWVEWWLQRPRRAAPSSLPEPVYRGGGVPSGSFDNPWRSNALVKARWWLWCGAVMLVPGWLHTHFPILAVPASPPGTGVSASSAMERIATRPPAPRENTCGPRAP